MSRHWLAIRLYIKYYNVAVAKYILECTLGLQGKEFNSYVHTISFMAYHIAGNFWKVKFSETHCSQTFWK